ncbi:MAG: hypothetical protein LPH21_18445 [Shewanella sp.]|nr:hypothetical protein [Shewanella sp.]
MSKHKKILSRVSIPTSLSFRSTPEMDNALKESSSTKLLEAVAAPFDMIMACNNRRGVQTQVSPHTLGEFDRLDEVMAMMYLGTDDDGKPRKDIDHHTAINALAAHYSCYIPDELQHLSATGDALVVLRDTPQGVYTQTKLPLADMICRDAYRTMHSAMTQEDAEWAANEANRYMMISRQLRNALNVVEGAQKAMNDVASAIRIEARQKEEDGETCSIIQ